MRHQSLLVGTENPFTTLRHFLIYQALEIAVEREKAVRQIDVQRSFEKPEVTLLVM